MIYSGSCDADRFNLFISKLVKVLPKGTVIVLDNASFHKSELARELVETAGCFLLFLPAYSPDLNPIEHTWAQIKSWLRRGFLFVKNKVRLIATLCSKLASG